MRFFLISVLAFSCQYTFSQFRGANWCFGDSIGFKFTGDSIIQFTSSITTYEASATISDEYGNLLFYTNGAKVWNKEHAIMTLGNHLFIGGVGWPLSTITQGVIILPDPGDTNQYYIFQNDNPYYYSKVDMTLSDGLGSVYIQNEILFDIPALEKMTAVKHGNGRDWWLIIAAYPEGGSDAFGDPLLYYEFLITPYGIDGPFIKEGINYLDKNIGIYAGQMKFDQSGSLLSVTNGRSIVIYDFDRCNGNLIKKHIIDSIFSGSNLDRIYGLEFSIDGSKLYATKAGGVGYGISKLLQYDLNADNIKESEFLINQEDEGSYYASLQLGLDGKIYFARPADGLEYGTDSASQNLYISVINNPNLSGTDCSFQKLGLYLDGKRITMTLPNMPNYTLGVLPKSACDTLSTSITEIKTNTDYQLFPNPVSSAFYISAKTDNGKPLQLYITDMFNKDVRLLQHYKPGSAVQTENLPNGLYVVRLLDEHQILYSEKILIIH